MPDATMTRTLNRNLLKYAVQRAIFNSDGSIADVRKSVLVEVTIEGGKHVMELMTGSQYDAYLSFAKTIGSLPAGSIIEVWDGRYLFGKSKAFQNNGYHKFES